VDACILTILNDPMDFAKLTCTPCDLFGTDTPGCGNATQGACLFMAGYTVKNTPT